MNEKKDNLEKFIKEELEKEAENIRREIQPDEGTMSQDAKERIQENLKQQIEEYDRERLYAELSEEDREALRLGYEMLRKKADKSADESTDRMAEEESNDKKPGKVVRKKRRLRVSLALAAALILVVGFGLNSFGVTEKAIRVVKIVIGGREVVQVHSSKQDKIITEEQEEEAYQLIRDNFRIEPVKIIARPEGMEFQKLEQDEGLQIAEFYYSYEGEKLLYMMSVNYRESSWGIDVEDKVTKEYPVETRGCVIQVKEYEMPESKKHRYSARFKYKGVEYFMVGTMEQKEFDEILENLYFSS